MPLDAEGARALASLRASAKRDAGVGGGGPDLDPATVPATAAATVGRFGVGFAAVVGLSEAPRVLSRDGGVAFSRTGARAEIAALGSPALDAEVAGRDGQVPVLRLPWPDAGAPPPGYDTAVLLPLRDAAALAAARAALDAVDDVLLLALPALDEVAVEVPGAAPRTLRDAAGRWHVLRRSGPLRAGGLAGLGPEETRRAAAAGWSCTWALPRVGRADDPLGGGLLTSAGAPPGGGAGTVSPVLPGVVLAPTPTDEALPWPAVLVLDAPLEPGRRALARVPATTTVLCAAAEAYADLLAERAAAGEDVLDLVPARLPASGVDAELRTALAPALARAAVLRPVGGGAPLRPGSAVLLDGDLGDDAGALEALAPLVGGLVSAPRRHRALLDALGAATLTLADLVEVVPLEQDPATWAALARALAPAAADPAAREQLALLPVPLAGGRSVRGARGVLVAADPSLAGALDVLAAHGLRVVDPRAVVEQVAADLLARLGARPVSARAVLDDPAVAAAVADADDGLDGADGGDADSGGAQGAWAGEPGGALVGALPSALSAAVLTLVARAVDDGDLRPGDLPWAGEVLLAAADGESLPAAGLVLPGSPAARLLDPDEVAEVHPELLERWGEPALLALGVASTLGVLRLGDVDVDDPPDALLDADGGAEWLDLVAPDGGVLADVVLVRDLDLVLPDRLGEAVALVAGDPVLRAAVVEPARRLPSPRASAARVTSHAAWWLGRETGAAGRADPDAPPGVRAVLGPVPDAVAGADPALRAALGAVRSWSQVPANAWQRVLDGQATGDGDVPGTADVLAMWRALAEVGTAELGLAETALGGPVLTGSGTPGPRTSGVTAAGFGPSRADLDPPGRLVALGPAGPLLADADDVVVVDAPRWRQTLTLGPQVVVPTHLATVLADALDVDLSSERGADARVRGSGVEREVPATVHDALPGCPDTWRDHASLVLDVAGRTETVGWWVDPDGAVHADGPASLACALAESAGAWGRRHAMAAVLLALADGDQAAAATALADEAAG